MTHFVHFWRENSNSKSAGGLAQLLKAATVRVLINAQFSIL